MRQRMPQVYILHVDWVSVQIQHRMDCSTQILRRNLVKLLSTFKISGWALNILPQIRPWSLLLFPPVTSQRKNIHLCKFNQAVSPALPAFLDICCVQQSMKAVLTSWSLQGPFHHFWSLFGLYFTKLVPILPKQQFEHEISFLQCLIGS